MFNYDGIVKINECIYEEEWSILLGNYSKNLYILSCGLLKAV